MENQFKDRLTSNELAERLANARKVMTKVDNGDYSKNNVSASKIRENTTPNEQKITPEQVSKPVTKQPINEDKIKNSKLPDFIKQAMIEHPIEQPNNSNVVNEDFMSNAKKLMEKEQPKTYKPNNNTSFDLESIKPFIENVIRDSIDKILSEKIKELLDAQNYTSINEGLLIKVGDSIFKGKITGYKEVENGKK